MLKLNYDKIKNITDNTALKQITTFVFLTNMEIATAKTIQEKQAIEKCTPMYDNTTDPHFIKQCIDKQYII